MIDLYLSFPDEAAARAVLYRTEGAVETDPENNIEAAEGYEMPNFANIDTVGVIYKPTGEMDAEGNPIMAALDGWHVNVRLFEGEDASALYAFARAPSKPLRIWG